MIRKRPSRWSQYCGKRKTNPISTITDLFLGFDNTEARYREFEKRFWVLVKIGAPDECWPWDGERKKDGYGNFRYGRFWLLYRRHQAHRMAFLLHNKVIDPKLLVMHTCDTPECVNWAHLTQGTNRENTHDAMKKGRLAHGERNGVSLLTEAKVTEMRKSYGTGEVTLKFLGYKYGVTPSAVQYVVTGKTWRHVA